MNNWTDHSPTENSGTIALTAGVKYDITMEYYENTGGAVAQLSWSSASTPKQIIPQTQLYPAAGGHPRTGRGQQPGRQQPHRQQHHADLDGPGRRREHRNGCKL